MLSLHCFILILNHYYQRSVFILTLIIDSTVAFLCAAVGNNIHINFQELRVSLLINKK